MNKFKKLSALLLTGALAITLSGCLGNKPETNIDLSNPDPKTPTQTTTVTNPDKPADPDTVTTPATVDVKEEIPVVQSGEAVRYNGQILFREYYPYAIENIALWGEFARSDTAYHAGNLYTFDPEDPTKITKVSEDPGFNDFYLVNETDLYGQACITGHYNEEKDQLDNIVYRKEVSSDQYEEICTGTIKGFAPDGSHFSVYDYSVNPYLQHLYIYDTSKDNNEVAHFVSDTGLIYLGMDNDNVYVLVGSAADDGKHYNITQIDYEGNEYLLGELNLEGYFEDYSMSYPEYFGAISYEEEVISFRLDFYEGTGHFYFASLEVTIPFARSKASTEGPIYEPIVKDITLDQDPNADTPASLQAFQSYPDSESGRGFAKVVQYSYDFDEGTFFTIADCHRSPEDDIGWRQSYFFLNMYYCFLPAGSNEYIVLDEMYEDLGVRGNLYQYETEEIEPTMYVYAGFFYDENKELVGIYYEPIEVNGPEAPIIESGYTFIADISKDLHYEYPDWEVTDWDSEDFFILTDLDEFTEIVYSWTADDYNGDCLKAAEYDYEGYLVFGPDDYSFEQYNSFMCHIGFDDEGNVNYIRPVIMD